MKRHPQFARLFTLIRGAGLTVAASLVLAGSGCAVDSGAGEDALSSRAGGEVALEDGDLPVPFASFATDDGGTVQFFEPEPGELMVTAVSKIESPDPVEKKLPAALYEELAGEPLPERFVAAHALGDRAAEGDGLDASLAESGEPDFSAASARNVQGVTRRDLTTAQFADQFCNQFTPLWCWLERTGTSYFSRRVDMMGALAYVYRGSVTHTLRRKNTWGNWKTLYSAAVPAGYLSSTSNFTNVAYTHESRVDDASGDGYHHSGHTL